MGRVIAAFAQFLDGNGDPVVNGWLQFLTTGSNNTLKATYADKNYQIANANPLQLDAEGRCPDVFGLGDYRVVSFLNDPEDEDSPGEQLQVFDPVTAQETITGSGGTGTVFDQWDATVYYDLGDIVTRNLIYYRSLANLNLGNDPELQEATWERVDFLFWWNSTVFYETGNMVFYDDNLWFSLIDSNQGNSPPTSPSAWRRGATGYKGFSNKTTDYTVVSLDRDWIICLGPSATADSTFDLPVMSTLTNGFKIGVINNSDYTLTIEAAGSAAIWLNSSGTLDVENGAFVELVYHSYMDTWEVTGNVGPTLGNQDIGTSTFPVNTLYATDVQVDTITATTSITVDVLNATTIHLPSDEYLYFGDSDEASIYYDSTVPGLRITASSGDYIGLTINDLDMWYADDTGAFLPGLTNPDPVIGSPTQSVDYLYANYLSLPDNGYLLIGDSDDLSIGFNGSIATLTSASSMTIGTTASATTLNMTINSSTLVSLSSTLLSSAVSLTVTATTPTITATTGTYFTRMLASGTNSYIDYNGGNLYIRYNTTTRVTLTSTGDATFTGNITGASDHRIGWASGYYLNYNSSSTRMEIWAGSSLRWYFDSTGYLIPYTDVTYNIGSATNHLFAVYTSNVRGDTSLGFQVDGSTVYLTGFFVGASFLTLYLTFGGVNYYFQATAV